MFTLPKGWCRSYVIKWSTVRLLCSGGCCRRLKGGYKVKYENGFYGPGDLQGDQGNHNLWAIDIPGHYYCNIKGTVTGWLTGLGVFWTQKWHLEKMPYLKKFLIFFHASFFGISRGSWGIRKTIKKSKICSLNSK